MRSTKSKEFEESDRTKLIKKKKQDVYIKIYDIEKSRNTKLPEELRNTLYSNQTGQFLKRSLCHNRYIMVMVEINSNAILVDPMKSRKDKEMKRAYEHLLLRLKRAGIQPKKHMLDNQVSDSMKNMIRDKYNMELELVPPGCHHQNAAEVAIRNFKTHFLSILAGTDPNFQMQLWDCLLPQAEITLNLLRQANANPKLLAYAYLNGPFDYNKMPLAPMGCKVQNHSVDGWYLYTSSEHYCTHNCHVKATRSKQLSNIVQFQHKDITNPTVTHANKLVNAIVTCINIISNICNGKNESDIRNLNQLLKATNRIVKHNGDKAIEEATEPSSTNPTETVKRDRNKATEETNC